MGSPSDILYKGFLRKKGGTFRQWHVRYFELSSHYLCYYYKDDKQKLLGQIPMKKYKVVPRPYDAVNDPDKYMFELVSENSQRSYIFAAPNDAERQSWIIVLRKALYAEFGGAIFGQSLHDTMEFEKLNNPRAEVPYIVWQCVNFIRMHGIETEGIFRKSASTAEIRSLRELFDSGRRPRLTTENCNPHIAANLLKQYLRELPEPVISYDIHDPCITLEGLYNQDKVDTIAKVAKIVSLLPVDNMQLLRCLLELLVEVGAHKQHNLMTLQNLAVVIAPNLLRPQHNSETDLMQNFGHYDHFCEILLTHYSEIFHQPIVINAPVSEGPTQDNKPKKPCRLSTKMNEPGDQLKDVGTSLSRVRSEMLQALRMMNSRTDNVQQSMSAMLTRLSKRDHHCASVADVARLSSVLDGTSNVCNTSDSDSARSSLLLGGPTSEHLKHYAVADFGSIDVNEVASCSSDDEDAVLDSSDMPYLRLHNYRTDSAFSGKLVNGANESTSADHHNDCQCTRLNLEDEAVLQKVLANGLRELDALKDIMAGQQQSLRSAVDIMQQTVDTLGSNLRLLQREIAEQENSYSEQLGRQAQNAAQLQRQLSEEQVATKTAVDRVFELQRLVERYADRFGPLVNDDD